MGQDLSILTDISIALDPLLVNANNERELLQTSALARRLSIPGFEKLQVLLKHGRYRFDDIREKRVHCGTHLLRGRRSYDGTRLAVHSLHAATTKPKLLERLINGVTKSRGSKSRKNSIDVEEPVSDNATVCGTSAKDNSCSALYDVFDTDELNTWKDSQITNSLLAEITENLSKCGSCSPKFLHHSRWRCSSPNDGAYSHPTSPDGTKSPILRCKSTGNSSISAPASPYVKHTSDNAKRRYQYHSVYNSDAAFKQAVMDKGYVKAMVDVINRSKSESHAEQSEKNAKTTNRVRDIYVTKFENASTKFVSCGSDLSSRSFDNRSDGQASTGTDDSGIQMNDQVFAHSKDLSKRSSGICFFTSDDGMLQSPADLFDKSWCDSKNIFESDLSDESDSDERIAAGDSDERIAAECAPQLCQTPSCHVPLEPPKDELEGSRPEDKLFNIAYELLKTERAYVERLRLVDQVFRVRVEAENDSQNFLPPDVIPRMFSNIHSIFQFHNEFLLPELEARMKQWDTVPKIGDLMKKNGPFLKLYSEYVRNFDHAMTLINQWTNKSPKFVEIMTKIHKMPECGHLSLQHHMLEPIQRVPRYELLLKDYLRHLQPLSSDCQDTQDALLLVTTAATHSNEAMRKLEGFRKLLEIHQSLGGSVDLISPTRELIKEGKITKISARREKTQERYILLFNDIILICSEHLLGTYRVRAKLDVTGMQVSEGANRNIPHTFKVRSKQKSIEFQAISADECEDWIMIIQQTIADLSRKKEIRGKMIQELELGCMAPEWVRDEAVTMCMSCAAPFTAFRRRHHCRACGMIVCGKCSSQRLALSYDENKMNRVCDKCHRTLSGSVTDDEADDAADATPRRPLLRIEANNPGAVMSGYLLVSTDHCKSWNRRWTVVHESFVLYLYKAHQDVCALTSLALPGYQVGDVPDNAETFRLYHQNSAVKAAEMYFTVKTAALCQRWIQVLQKVVHAELPSPEPKRDTKQERLSSGSESSTGSGDLKST